MIANKECYERGCACYDDRVDSGGIKVIAKREWVGLTPQERDEINEQVYGAVPHHVAFHAAIEAKLKEKNSDHRN